MTDPLLASLPVPKWAKEQMAAVRVGPMRIPENEPWTKAQCVKAYRIVCLVIRGTDPIEEFNP